MTIDIYRPKIQYGWFLPVTDSFWKTGMRSMQELFFGLVGWDRTVCALYVFIFVTQNSITLKKRKDCRKTGKKILIYLNSHRYCVIYYLYCLNTSALKWNASLSYTYCCLLCRCCLVSSHNALYFPFGRECVVWQDHITVVKETTLTAITPAERKSKLFVYS